MKPLSPRSDSPGVELDTSAVLPERTQLAPESLWRATCAVPVAREPGRGRTTLVVVMRDPDDLVAIDDLAFATGMRIRALRGEEQQILRALGPSSEPPAPGNWLAPEVIELGPEEEDPTLLPGWLVPLAEVS
ncbi:MAG TPA: hypothetical protein VMK42_03160 [Anaeromyxobacteraceae bacterium]|nr:hypothetical protein [Anaeromyxobacteraceae bacterium]